ncbi:MAG: FHA domain-containing protein [Gammaproteobacteria bacterium]|nr:FHA domain-containing protein [Gammaproteobacteria bacterium]
MAMIIQTVDGVVSNRFDIEKTALKFGRSSSNQVQIDDLAVSSKHAQIVVKQNEDGMDAYYLQDLDSTNGTFLNEEFVEADQQLHHNDNIRIGWNNFIFIDENEVDLEKTSEIKKSWIPGVYYTKDK